MSREIDDYAQDKVGSGVEEVNDYTRQDLGNGVIKIRYWKAAGKNLHWLGILGLGLPNLGILAAKGLNALNPPWQQYYFDASSGKKITKEQAMNRNDELEQQRKAQQAAEEQRRKQEQQEQRKREQSAEEQRKRQKQAQEQKQKERQAALKKKQDQQKQQARRKTLSEQLNKLMKSAQTAKAEAEKALQDEAEFGISKKDNSAEARFQDALNNYVQAQNIIKQLKGDPVAQCLKGVVDGEIATLKERIEKVKKSQENKLNLINQSGISIFESSEMSLNQNQKQVRLQDYN